MAFDNIADTMTEQGKPDRRQDGNPPLIYLGFMRKNDLILGSPAGAHIPHAHSGIHRDQVGIRLSGTQDLGLFQFFGEKFEAMRLVRKPGVGPIGETAQVILIRPRNDAL